MLLPCLPVIADELFKKALRKEEMI